MSDELTTREEVTKRGYLQLSGLREGCSEQDGRDYLKEHRATSGTIRTYLGKERKNGKVRKETARLALLGGVSSAADTSELAVYFRFLGLPSFLPSLVFRFFGWLPPIPSPSSPSRVDNQALLNVPATSNPGPGPDPHPWSPLTPHPPLTQIPTLNRNPNKPF